MLKKLVILILFVVIGGVGYSVEKTYYEDTEIERLQHEIERIEHRIKRLELSKKRRVERERMGERPKVGLVLSGGGAKGFAHIGVLKELEKRGIIIDYITGTSMGAIVGAMYSVGYTPDEIEEVIGGINWDELLKDIPDRRDIPLEERIASERYSASVAYDNEFNVYFPKGVKQGQRMYLKLKEILGSSSETMDFSELPIPLRIIATDLDSGAATTFTEGDLAKVVNASIAIPTLLEPVQIRERYYVDGMVARNLPVEDIVKMGADIVIAVDVGVELSGRDEYNILTVLDQLMAIQSSSSTPAQRKMADVLIEPDISSYKTTDFNKAKDIIAQGKREAGKILDEIELKSGEKIRRYPIEKRKKIVKNEMYVTDIFLKGNKNIDEKIVEAKLGKQLPAMVTTAELEGLVLDLYALSYIDKVYYEVKDGALYIEVIERPSNYLRLGFNYDSEYGTTIALNTDIQNIGLAGSRSTFGVSFGDYLNLNANHFMYYGLDNKIGLLFNLSYDERPLFIYENNKKKSELTTKSIEARGSVATQINDQIFIAYGYSQKFSELTQDVGRDVYRQLEYDETYGSLFFSLTVDSLDRIDYPTKGVKSDFEYLWGGTMGTQNVDFYGPSYILEGYYPLTERLTFMSAIGGGSVKGEDILPNEYFKLGGIRNDVKNKEFSFYGYNSQRKLADEFLMGQLGVQYRVYSNLYLIFKWNMATYSGAPIQTTNTNEMWDDKEQGYGMTIGVDSPLGPLELTLMQDTDNSELLTQFNMGYIF